mgnify:CR=1 FL=1
MIESLIDCYQVVNATEGNKIILNELKIKFTEVESRTGGKYFRLFRTASSLDTWDIIEELTRWRVQTFNDAVLLD